LLSFTGSTATGRKILECAARSNNKPVILECGGKSPHVVCDDVDHLDAVADAVVQGLVWNQGQVCSANTRLLVHEKLKRVLLEKVVERASQYCPADPLEESTVFGPLASGAQRDRVSRYVREGLDAGAVAVLRGSVQEAGGCYVSPTVFDNVRPTMSIAREEIFGPVLCVQDFCSEGEAIRLANDTEYGLEATVWTRDMGRGKRLARAIKTAAVMVRTAGPEASSLGYGLSYEPRKASGFGAEIGVRGLQSYSALKLVGFAGE
jgi:acyl-CoA reductase-like NAD-dependent aldehyde dehydrogenase